MHGMLSFNLCVMMFIRLQRVRGSRGSDGDVCYVNVAAVVVNANWLGRLYVLEELLCWYA